ncbi:hypothetical protein [Pedobacter sp. V48]|uniref:hypothetical protein n=1 Tax=Pedobacter sp. V48 TaxID=509635 RepID=UPI0003E50020|nr:hypothetical protein [Pedobacter sp. V48]ETZ23085.1 hypothetical protein N824_20830 [Pedobacter sp. V48]
MDRKKIDNVTLRIGVPVFSFFIIFFAFKIYNNRSLSLSNSFSGVIDKVRYEEPKHLPYITIAGKEYDVFHYYWGQDTLAVGDSVMKKKGTLDLILFKN